MGQQRSAHCAVISVHGTGDTAAGPDGEKWFQNGSAFVDRLKARLAGQGVEADILPHLWTGANSATAREKGSRELVRLINRLANTHASVHVVGHSHGGNVANDAACMLGWSLAQRAPKIASITTVGTPFFRTRVTWSEWIGAWAFLLLITAFAVLVAGHALVQIIEYYGDVMERDYVGTMATRIIATIAGFAVLAPLAVQGILHVRRARRRRRADTSFFSIWHPKDEAIAFLQRVEKLKIEPFPKGTFWRRSRSGAIVWAVRIALGLPLITFLLGLFLLPLSLMNIGQGLLNRTLFTVEEFYVPIVNQDYYWDVSINFIVLSIGLGSFVFTPVVFAVVYGGYRLGSLLALELWLREPLNRMVGGSLQGVAFGRDGDNRVCDVASCSHYYTTERAVLDGEVAARMTAAAATATRALFDKYRGGLFSVDVDDNNAMAELTQDAMTWDSLIHTTYFDQPEMADTIGDYIAIAAKRAARA